MSFCHCRRDSVNNVCHTRPSTFENEWLHFIWVFFLFVFMFVLLFICFIACGCMDHCRCSQHPDLNKYIILHGKSCLMQESQCTQRVCALCCWNVIFLPPSRKHSRVNIHVNEIAVFREMKLSLNIPHLYVDTHARRLSFHLAIE